MANKEYEKLPLLILVLVLNLVLQIGCRSISTLIIATHSITEPLATVK